MPVVPPLTSSGSRALKRPRPVPKPVRDAIRLMVYGKPDDPDGRPLAFIEAGRETGVKPDVMRRYLDRPAVIALLRRERRAYREALCGGNEGALRRVRDTAENSMAVVAAVRQLETMSADDAGRASGESSPQHFQINLISRVEQPPPVTIEGRATPADRFIAKPGVRVPYATGRLEAKSDPPANPIFKPFRP